MNEGRSQSNVWRSITEDVRLRRIDHPDEALRSLGAFGPGDDAARLVRVLLTCVLHDLLYEISPDHQHGYRVRAASRGPHPTWGAGQGSPCAVIASK